MPRIIFLLLIASSPLIALGDESASWGRVSSGPSESECRPYIEKALQGASIYDSTSQPGDTDDVGATELGEEAIAQSEVSESKSSEILPDDKETIEQIENEGPLESAEQNENESIEELVESPAIEEENNENSNEEPQVSNESGGVAAITENVEVPGSNENEEISAETVVGTVSDEDTGEETVRKSEYADETSQEITNNENPEVHSEGSGEDEQSTEQVGEEGRAAESTEVHSTEETSEEVNIKTEEARISAEMDGLSEPDASDQSEPSINENEESQEENMEATGEVTESQEETVEQQPNGEEATTDEDISEEKEISSTVQEEDTSDETPPTIEDIGESLIGESEELSEKNEIPNESNKETDESSETADKSDEKSEEATDQSTERGDNKSEETTEELIETQKEESDLPESEGESEETDLKAEAVQGSDETPVEEAPEASAEESIPPESGESGHKIDVEQEKTAAEVSGADPSESQEAVEIEGTPESEEPEGSEEASETGAEEEEEQPTPEEELSIAIEIPEKLRSREHMAQILRLNAEKEEQEKLLSKTIENTLRELKKLYDIAIKPLEILYKYRDLSNRHFGDPEIFSKPLILFMGPWSGGKSTIINYLLENEYKETALRTGAEPSPAYFNIVMWGEHAEVLDGTQLAADWTFSGLQKFGQGLLDRLRGLKLNHPLLEKVNIVEIPGILEIRKQVERLFPFNDACQWFIDRADIIFLVYDPSKLDVGPETEAILDQLKGREMQTRIILNKADQVKPEELMRVQGTLIWNISPLMSSTEPPIMYSTSLWSLPYEAGAPSRLLYAQERAFLKDLRDAMDKRVENKIASARRFAVRVRNHAKMVDCYLTTYYNHKSFFGNKKKISDDIIEHPQNYHIYEGLSTLTNISRYDLPDPDVYRDFFRLNPVYEFQQLSSTCTYFRGCPINRLDVAIAYDLPELVGKYKKQVEEVLNSVKK